MTRGVRWLLLGSLVLVTLAGCGRSYFQFAQREPWRREAELACLNSGTVRQGAGVVRISPIEGAGVCGADFPLKVTALGESAALGFADEVIRPPGAIGGASRPLPEPRWPISQSPYRAPPPAPRYAPPSHPGAPMSIEAPGTAQAATPQSYPPPQQGDQPPAQRGAPPSNLRAPSNWRSSAGRPGSYQSQPLRAPAARAQDDDVEELPPYARPGAAPLAPMQRARPLPPLGPQRNPRVVAASAPVEVHPAATLACPMVSALDRWIANAVQPAAQKRFGQPVVEIKQISAYSCRGMNG
ncbi:MAG: extensin family protein, partial [Xanthobacteraceae bacterium]